MRGDLSEIPAADLCRRLADVAASGVLDIEGPDGRGTVVLRQGRVVGATSPSPSARLGDRLVGAGLLREDALADVLRDQARASTHQRLGQLLVDRGLVPQDAVRLVVQEQVIDAVFDVIRWRYGAFRFETDDLGDVAQVPLSIPVDQLLVEVSRRQDEWAALQRIIPDLDAVPTFRDGTGSAAASLEPDEFAILASIDGARTIRDLATDLGYGEFEAARIVYGLTLLGIVEVQLPEDEIGRALEEAMDELAAMPHAGFEEPSADGDRDPLDGRWQVPVEPEPPVVADPPAAEDPPAAAPVTPSPPPPDPETAPEPEPEPIEPPAATEVTPEPIEPPAAESTPEPLEPPEATPATPAEPSPAMPAPPPPPAAAPPAPVAPPPSPPRAEPPAPAAAPQAPAATPPAAAAGTPPPPAEAPPVEAPPAAEGPPPAAARPRAPEHRDLADLGRVIADLGGASDEPDPEPHPAPEPEPTPQPAEVEPAASGGREVSELLRELSRLTLEEAPPPSVRRDPPRRDPPPQRDGPHDRRSEPAKDDRGKRRRLFGRG